MCCYSKLSGKLGECKILVTAGRAFSKYGHYNVKLVLSCLIRLKISAFCCYAGNNILALCWIRYLSYWRPSNFISATAYSKKYLKLLIFFAYFWCEWGYCPTVHEILPCISSAVMKCMAQLVLCGFWGRRVTIWDASVGFRLIVKSSYYFTPVCCATLTIFETLESLLFFSLKKPFGSLGKLLIRFDMQPLVYLIILRTLSRVNVHVVKNKKRQSNTRLLEMQTTGWSLHGWNLALVLSLSTAHNSVGKKSFVKCEHTWPSSAQNWSLSWGTLQMWIKIFDKIIQPNFILVREKKVRIGCVQAGDEVKVEIMDCLESLANKLMNGRSTPSGKRHPEAYLLQEFFRFLQACAYRKLECKSNFSFKHWKSSQPLNLELTGFPAKFFVGVLHLDTWAPTFCTRKKMFTFFLFSLDWPSRVSLLHVYCSRLHRCFVC